MPRIAIPLPTLSDSAYNRQSWENYAEAVRAAGGEAVALELSLGRAEQESLAESCDGICLPGSPADVEPGRYGAERDEASAAADPVREAVDFLLLDHAERTGKPLLGICFGAQTMNVRHGGTLVQDILPTPVNHAAGRSVAVAHMAMIAKTSFLATLVNRKEATDDGEFLRLPVNSSHHQAIASPGDGLRIVARCPEDGVIEAIEGDPAFPMQHEPGRFYLGVQWHPERSTAISATSRNLFHNLVAEAVLWRAAQSGTNGAKVAI